MMNRRISPTSWFLIVIIIVMAVFFVTSLGYADLRVKLMPLLMSGVTIVLSLIALLQDVKSGSKGSMPTDEEGEVIEDEGKRKTPLGAYFKAFLWLAALIVLVYLFGFVIGILVWMPVYLWKQGNRWWTALLAAVITVVAFYVAFTMALQVELWEGKLFEVLSWRL